MSQKARINRVAVIIPAYKETIDQFELSSLKQCRSVLIDIPKILVCGDDLNTGVYVKSIPEIRIECFNRDYFKNIEGYSRLLLCCEFYERFRDFEYLLIYQLDSWVFRNELEYWCGKGYDYIGAPWFENYGSNEMGNILWTVGNGGFSLRKVSAFLSVLKFVGPLFKIKGLKNIYPEKDTLMRNIKRILKIATFRISSKNRVSYFLQNFKAGEDTFWTVFLMNSESPLKIPECREALAFSFEKSPAYLYGLTGEKLPFGCHAWRKNDYDIFWKDYIT